MYVGHAPRHSAGRYACRRRETSMPITMLVPESTRPLLVLLTDFFDGGVALARFWLLTQVLRAALRFTMLSVVVPPAISRLSRHSIFVSFIERPPFALSFQGVSTSRRRESRPSRAVSLLELSESA